MVPTALTSQIINVDVAERSADVARVEHLIGADSLQKSGPNNISWSSRNFRSRRSVSRRNIFPIPSLKDDIERKTTCRTQECVAGTVADNFPKGLFSNSLPLEFANDIQLTNLKNQFAFDCSSEDDDSLSSFSMDEQSADCISAAAVARVNEAACFKSKDVSDEQGEIGLPLEDHAVYRRDISSASCPSLDNTLHCKRSSFSANPWVIAGQKRFNPPNPNFDKVGCVSIQLRVACHLSLLREKQHPARRMSTQILNVLLGATSPLTKVILRLVEDSLGPELPLPQLARELCVSSGTSHLHTVVHCRAHALSRCSQLDILGDKALGFDLFAKPPCHDAIVHRALRCGLLFEALRLFVNAYHDGHLGIMLSGVAKFVDFLLQRYTEGILSLFFMDDQSLAERNGRTSNIYEVTPWLLLLEAEKFMTDFIMLNRVLVQIEATSGAGCEILNVCYRGACQYYGDQVLYKMFIAAALPYFRILWDWSFSASYMRDSKVEFFGTVLGLSADAAEDLRAVEETETASKDGNDCGSFLAVYPTFLDKQTAELILRCGRARALLGRVSPKHAILDVPQPDLDKHLMNAVSSDGLNEIVEVLRRYVLSVENFERCDSRSGDVNNMDHPHDKSRDSPGLKVDSLNTECSCKKLGKCDFGTQRRFFAFPGGDNDGIAVDSLTSWPKDLEATCKHSCQIFNDGTVELWDPTTGSNAPPDISKLEEEHIAGSFPSVFGYQSECFERGWPLLDEVIKDLLVEPITRVNAVVQRQVYIYFVEQVNIMDHLNALWKYVLLGAGDYADALVERIDIASQTITANENHIMHQQVFDDPKISGIYSGSAGFARRKRVCLAECLTAALNMCGADADPCTARLRVDLVDQDIDDTSSSSTHGTLDDYNDISFNNSRSLWHGDMKVDYFAEFPMNFIISSHVLSRFSVFFNFFTRVRRAEQCLRRLFMTFCRQSSLRANSTHQRTLVSNARLCTRVWRFCWEAQHFVRIVGDYEATQVISLSWKALLARQDELQSNTCSSDIWSLRDAVNAFLDDATRRALLEERQRNVMKVIFSAFDIVVSLESLLSPASHPGLAHSDEEMEWYVGEVNLSAHNLQRRARFLVDVLQKALATSSADEHSHLTDLLTRLNYNSFYEEQDSFTRMITGMHSP